MEMILTFEPVQQLPDSPGRGQKALWPAKVVEYAAQVPVGSWFKVNGLHVKRCPTLRSVGLKARTRVGIVYVEGTKQ